MSLSKLPWLTARATRVHSCTIYAL